MKNLLKIFCIYILLGFVSIIYLLISSETSLSNILGSFLSPLSGGLIDYIDQNFVQKFAYFFLDTITLIITVTFCAIRMSKKNENIAIRLVPLYLIVGLVLKALMTFINLEDANESVYKVINDIYNFIYYTNFFLLPVCMLSNLNPNNQIARMLKITGYILVAISGISIIFLYVRIYFATKLPTIYTYDSFNFQSLAKSLTITIKIVIVSVVGEISAIMLGFMTNYAFETDTLESDVLDMDELMEQANRVAEEKQKELYARKEKKREIDRSVSETSGRMNVDNQLGAHSNVGVVNKDEQTESIIERALPSSSGPVINAQATVPVMTAPTTPAAPTPQQVVQQAPSQPQPQAQVQPQVAQTQVVQQPTQPVQPAQQTVQQPPTNQ